MNKSKTFIMTDVEARLKEKAANSRGARGPDGDSWDLSTVQKMFHLYNLKPAVIDYEDNIDDITAKDKEILRLKQEKEFLEKQNSKLKEKNEFLVRQDKARSIEHSNLIADYYLIKKRYNDLLLNQPKNSTPTDLKEFVSISSVILKVMHPDKNQKFLKSLTEEQARQYNQFVSFLLDKLKR